MSLCSDRTIHCDYVNSKHIGCCFRENFDRCVALNKCDFEDGICRFYKTDVEGMPVYMRGAKND